MIHFTAEAPMNLQSQYVVAGFNATSREGREIRVVFIIGKRFAMQDLGIREAATDLDVVLKHPKLKSYIESTLGKFERKTSFAKSLYIVPEVNEDLAVYLDNKTRLSGTTSA